MKSVEVQETFGLKNKQIEEIKNYHIRHSEINIQIPYSFIFTMKNFFEKKFEILFPLKTI